MNKDSLIQYMKETEFDAWSPISQKALDYIPALMVNILNLYYSDLKYAICREHSKYPDDGYYEGHFISDEFYNGILISSYTIEPGSILIQEDRNRNEIELPLYINIRSDLMIMNSGERINRYSEQVRVYNYSDLVKFLFTLQNTFREVIPKDMHQLRKRWIRNDDSSFVWGLINEYMEDDE